MASRIFRAVLVKGGCALRWSLPEGGVEVGEVSEESAVRVRLEYALSTREEEVEDKVEESEIC